MQTCQYRAIIFGYFAHSLSSSYEFGRFRLSLVFSPLGFPFVQNFAKVILSFKKICFL